jgi:protein-tyrosine-phosphatase
MGPGPGSGALPGAVLFACNFNVVRSPMAAGLMRSLYGNRVFVDCCGLRAGEAVDPFAVAAMEEFGVDLSGHRPKRFEDLEDGSFDLVISLAAQAQHRAVELARGRATDIEYWPTMDPTLESGSREQRLEGYRAVRDGLRQRILDRFGRPATFGG